MDIVGVEDKQLAQEVEDKQLVLEVEDKFLEREDIAVEGDSWQVGIVVVGIVVVGIVEVDIAGVGKVVLVVGLECYNHREVGVGRRVDLDHSGQNCRMKEVPLLRTRPFHHSCYRVERFTIKSQCKLEIEKSLKGLIK